MYNAQTPAAMFTGRSEMPAETPAAYPPHERTGKTAFSKPLHVFLHLLYPFTTTRAFQNWTRTGWSTRLMRRTRSG